MRHEIHHMNVVKPRRCADRSTLFVGVVLCLDLGCAVAGPCSAEIAEIENNLRPPAAAPAPRGTPPAAPAKPTEATYDAALARARLLDAADDPKCKNALTEVKILLGM
jgi:hypothetical protein